MFAARILVLFFITFGITFGQQFVNYRVSNENAYSPEEVTIAINPQNPAILAAGSNLNYFYSSTDYGRTWSQSQMSSTFGVWGDPVVLFDESGNLYYVHLSNPNDGYWIDRIVIQKSTDNGETFNDGTYTGVFPPHNQDKAWIAVDLTSSQYRNNLYVTWTEFDDYGSSNPQDKSRILFSKSTDFAETWSEPVKINDVDGDCVDSDNTVEGAVPAVGPNGEIYVAWAGPVGIVFDKSTDGGETWGEDIFVSEQPGGWDYDVSGIYRSNGLPVTVCDTSSNSPYKGNIYVLWSDQRNGETNPDVFISKSTDGGETWSEAIRVNNDSGHRPQFFAWLAVDQRNGNLYATFYDRRNTTGTNTEFWLARSTDAGETWQNYCITDEPFPTQSSVFFGDYATVAAYEGKIHPIWMETDSEGNLSVWTANINDDDLTDVETQENEIPSEFVLEQNYPNPFNPTTNITYVIASGKDAINRISTKNRNDGSVRVSVKVYDALAREVATLVNEKQSPGKYSVQFEAKSASGGLPSGIYFYTLRAGSFVQTRKMVLMK